MDALFFISLYHFFPTSFLGCSLRIAIEERCKRQSKLVTVHLFFNILFGFTIANAIVTVLLFNSSYNYHLKDVSNFVLSTYIGNG